MRVDFLEEEDSISFFSPLIHNGGLTIHKCLNIEDAKNKITSYFKEVQKIDITLRRVQTPTTLFIAGIHTP